MKIVSMSDTHNSHADVDVPFGDVLLHAGDFTFQGEWEVYEDADDWFGTLPHKHKLIIAGNHDFGFYDFPWKNATPLLDSGIEIDGLKFWGSPYSPTFGDWAWMKDRGEAIAEHWKKIPDETDVLLVHGPAYGIGDLTPPRYGLRHVGCADLYGTLCRVKPKLFVCGHIHNGYGKYGLGETAYVNASICNENYDPVNKPIVVTVKPGGEGSEKP